MQLKICHSYAEIKNLFFNEASVKYIKIMSLVIMSKKHIE